MIQRVRRQFIRISVAVLTVVMVLLAVIINVANWAAVKQDIADTADELAQASFGVNHGKAFGLRGKKGESLYENRYFVITLGEDESQVELSHVSSYTAEDAKTLAEKAVATGRTSGFLEDCYFQIYTEDSCQRILFLNVASRLENVYQLIRISVIACLAGIAVACLLMVLLSRRAIRPIVENYEKQKRFITDASHELKTPLSVISANMELLAMDDPDNEWIHSTRRQLGLLNRMVRDMVFLARSDEQSQTPVFSELDLAALLRDTADPFCAMAEASDKQLTVVAPEKLSVRGDAKGLERLISVLCDNAVKYSQDNDNITLSLSRKGAYAIIESVNVPAEPISEEKLKHLFDRFYRADEARSKSSARSGFGIGLAIAQAVAQSHGGDAKATMKNDKLHITCRLKVCGQTPETQH